MLENDVQVKIFSTIASLESSIKSQVEIDNAYDQFCNTVKSCMDNDLQKRHIKLDSGVSNKKRKILQNSSGIACNQFLFSYLYPQGLLAISLYFPISFLRDCLQSVCIFLSLQKLRVRLGTCKTGLSPPVTLCY